MTNEFTTKKSKENKTNSQIQLVSYSSENDWLEENSKPIHEYPHNLENPPLEITRGEYGTGVSSSLNNLVKADTPAAYHWPIPRPGDSLETREDKAKLRYTLIKIPGASYMWLCSCAYCKSRDEKRMYYHKNNYRLEKYYICDGCCDLVLERRAKEKVEKNRKTSTGDVLGGIAGVGALVIAPIFPWPLLGLLGAGAIKAIKNAKNQSKSCRFGDIACLTNLRRIDRP